LNINWGREKTCLVSWLRRLIHGDDGCISAQFCGHLYHFAKLKSCGTVKTSRAVIPTLDRAHAKRRFSNADTFTLTTTNASDPVTTNLGVDRMSDTKDGHDHITEVLSVYYTANTRESVGWGSRKCCKLQCLPDGELRKVYIGLGLVDDLAAEATVHDIP
jgi:hypothetical protein